MSSNAATDGAPIRPDWLPDTFFDPKSGPKVDDIKRAFTERDELRAFKAADDSRKLTLPQKPEDFKLELPKDFKAPEGVEIKFDEKDPLLAQARQTALELGVDQTGFSRLLALHAGALAGTEQQFKAAQDAELTKLGAAGPARITAVNTFLDAKGYGALKPMMVSAEIVQALEKLMADTRSQGGAGFSQQHRDTQETNGKIPGYDTMSFEQRREAQDKSAAARR